MDTSTIKELNNKEKLLKTIDRKALTSKKWKFKPMKKTCLIILTLLIAVLILTTATVAKGQITTKPTEVSVGVWLINVEKVDLAQSTFKLDFYLWFKFDPVLSSEVAVKDWIFLVQ